MTQELQKVNDFALTISDKSKEYSLLKIEGIEDKKGYAAVDVARKEIKSMRVLIEKTFKAERDILNVKVKENLAKEKEVLALVSPLELELKAKTDVIDNEKARIKAEEEAREAARIEARYAKINKLGLTFDGSTYSYGENRLSNIDIQTASDVVIDTFIENVLMQKEAEEATRKAEAERIEKENARIAAEQKAEAERLAAIKAEQDKIAAEQAAAAAKIKAQQDAIDAENARIEKQKQDAINEAKRLAELEQAKKDAAEKAVKDAETKRIADEKAKAESEAMAAEKARKKALNAPEKTKLLNYAKELRACVCVDLSTDEAKIIMQEVELKLAELLTFIESESNKL